MPCLMVCLSLPQHSIQPFHAGTLAFALHGGVGMSALAYLYRAFYGPFLPQLKQVRQRCLIFIQVQPAELIPTRHKAYSLPRLLVASPTPGRSGHLAAPRNQGDKVLHPAANSRTQDANIMLTTTPLRPLLLARVYIWYRPLGTD